MKLRSIKQIKNLKGKQVLLRVDFNVPVEKGKVRDDWRIQAILPTLEFLRDKKAKIIIISHLGRPKGRPNKKLSLKSVFNHLKKLMKFKVEFATAAIGSKVLSTKIQKMKLGGILMLENIRFYSGEEKNNPEFIKKLSELGDIFVNDAFAVSHRDCASVTGVVKHLPTYAGLNLIKEVGALNNVVKKPKRPMVILMGGAKISSKIGVIKKLLPKSKVVLVGGALANNFLKALGYKIGSSLYEPRTTWGAGSPLRSEKIILPQDVVITNGKKIEVRSVGKNKNLCPKGFKIVDIGPKTIKEYSDYIRKAQTIVWNGPMGLFEKQPFSYGSTSMAQIVGARSTGPAFGLVGGGETIEVLKKSGMEKYVDWISTGGGAMLEFLEKGTLVGIKPLKK